MDRRSWFWFLTLASIWGASYLLIKIGLRDLSPEMVAFARIALAAIVLLPFAASRGELAPLRDRLGVLALLGFVQVAAPFLLIAVAEGAISSSLAGILVAAAPIFTAILALRLDPDERSEGTRLAGVGIGIVGVAALFGLDLTGSGSAVLGGLAVVLAAVGYALGGFIVKSRLSDAPALGIVSVVMASSALMLLVPALLALPSSAPGLGPVAAMAGLGIGGTGIAFVIFYWLIAREGPARAMLVSYIAPGFAVVYGAVFLSEGITAGKLIGLALILTGSWLGAGGAERRPELASVQPAPELSAATLARSDAATR